MSPEMGAVIVREASLFAIESEITKVVPSISQRALGFFVIHVCGRRFGVQEPDASMLGCSFEEVNSRLQRCGTHCARVLRDINAADVAEAYLDAIYRDTSRTDYFGLSHQGFVEVVHSSAIRWAPDGDEAFDDGSVVLHLDVENRVRLIAFNNTDVADDMIGTIREVWLDADLFYGVLSRWRDNFDAEWESRLDLPA